MNFNIVTLLCVLILGLVIEAKHKQKLLALYKEATKGLSKEAKRGFFRKLGRRMKRGMRSVGRGIKKGAKTGVRGIGKFGKTGFNIAKGVAMNEQFGGIIRAVSPGAAFAFDAVRSLKSRRQEPEE
eukprot:TRINITY_DN7148_c0_g1_i15.p3 TRINITY_DN7148_c0_g1~~TRINITY_DN7148_c0_g1_i15.p3  ORF type:complete len:126 (-),score=23.62 TRINITY_DN7148_c0_g1_i15:249-626(-)